MDLTGILRLQGSHTDRRPCISWLFYFIWFIYLFVLVSCIISEICVIIIVSGERGWWQLLSSFVAPPVAAGPHLGRGPPSEVNALALRFPSSPSQSFIVVIFSWFVSWRAPLTDVRRSVVSTGRLVLSQQLFSLLVFSNAVTTSSCCSRGGPSLGRPPPMPFMSLLESLNNVSGFQHVVICLDPPNHFFIQHLSEVHNLSNKSSMCLFFILQLVS